MVLLSFCFFLLIFIAIGMLSTLKSEPTSKDYLLASGKIKPCLAGLSAIASGNSGYMFIGMIGYTYTMGMSSIWLVGWVFGDWLTSFLVHKKICLVTKRENVLSYAGVLSCWHGTDYRILRVVAGCITLVFLGIYAAAQFNAGSKALHVIFGWNYAIGAVIGAIMVLVYCVAGGIRASIWTDVAQAVVMIIAMMLLFIMSVVKMGGITAFFTAVHQVSPTYGSFYPQTPLHSFMGPILFVVGWLFGGIGVIGQPHVMVRFMAMENANDIRRVRFYYYGWYFVFYLLTIGAGLASRLLLSESGGFDAELALPTLANNLLPGFLVGLVLAGLFAATMSTADSQVLSCSAAVTNDMMRKKKISYWGNKIVTILVVLVALCIALSRNESIFNLVLIAWAALGASFGPLLIVYACGGKPSEKVAISIIFMGLGTMLVWRFLGLNTIVYGLAPAFLVAFIWFIITSLWNRKKS